MAKIVFRTDASLLVGAGHVMRCLTLARALRQKGHDCVFICREHAGNLNELINREGFVVHGLPLGREQDNNLTHASWLGSSQAEDTRACQALIAAWQPDWLVVDHYALDHRWESAVTPVGCRLLVIDDLADRKHACDLLLDQNLGRDAKDYRALLPAHCELLIGPSHALLRPEFAAMREASLLRRQQASLQEVLIALGGVDQHNHTGAVLEALKRCELPAGTRFTVVMGATAPHLQVVMATASQCPWPVEVLSGISNMAERMAGADLAIGAGGGSSWERCCLGLPTLLIALAENQMPGSFALAATGAAKLIELAAPLDTQLQVAFLTIAQPSSLRALAEAASRVTDGRGVDRVLQIMERL